MIEVWGRTNSANVKKVLWTLEELGLPYVRHDAGGAFGVVDTAEFRAMNPNGLVPVLADGDVTLWESNTIVRYLAARHGDGKLMALDPIGRARAEQWMDWGHSFAAPFRPVVFGLLRTPPEKRDLAAIEAGRRICADLWQIADATLADRRFVAGDDFGVADIVLGPFAYVWFGLDIERPATPNLDRWLGELRTRPAWAKVVAIGLS